MSDYIKREDAIKAIVGHLVPKQYDGDLVNAGFEVAHEIVDALPSADVVEVVRCGECEYWKCNPNTDEYGVCKKVSYDDFEVVMDADDFCSYGEKKEQDHDV